MMIMRLLSIMFAASAWIVSSMVSASERDFVLPDDDINDQVESVLVLVETWEEKYQRLVTLMSKREVVSKSYAHPLDQEYDRLERVVHKARLLHDVAKGYSTVEQQVKALYQRSLNYDDQEMSKKRAWTTAISSSREMIQVGYHLDNRPLNAELINLMLSSLSENQRDQRELLADMDRIKKFMRLRHRELIGYKERLRDWIRVLRSEAWSG